MGYFPCTPYHPTLAVEICMLLFVTKLFVRISPNNTAWCTTVKDFLQGLGYHLASAVCALDSPIELALILYKSGLILLLIGIALMWFNSLQAATTSHTDKVLLCVCKLITELDDGIQQPAHSEIPLAMLTVASRPLLRRLKRKRKRVLPMLILLILHKKVGKSQGYPQSFPSLSPPLRHVQVITCSLDVHCALAGKRAMTLKGAPFISILYSCSSSQHPTKPDAIVCADACFTQKHNQQIHDPACCHSQTMFITKADVQHMENYVDGIMSSKAS